MIIVAYILAGYLGGILLLGCWDAFIGFGFEFDGDDYPPLGLALVTWPLAFPICFVCSLVGRLGNIKQRRLDKAENEKKVRIQLEKETAAYIEQLTQEIELKNVLRKDQDR